MAKKTDQWKTEMTEPCRKSLECDFLSKGGRESSNFIYSLKSLMSIYCVPGTGFSLDTKANRQNSLPFRSFHSSGSAVSPSWEPLLALLGFWKGFLVGCLSLFNSENVKIQKISHFEPYNYITLLHITFQRTT
jgi:hypothetical protein